MDTAGPTDSSPIRPNPRQPHLSTMAHPNPPPDVSDGQPEQTPNPAPNATLSNHGPTHAYSQPQSHPLSHTQSHSYGHGHDIDEKATVSTFGPEEELDPVTPHSPPPLSRHDTNKDEATRINDDLQLLRAERLVSDREQYRRNSKRHHEPETEDTFNIKEEPPRHQPPPKEPAKLNKIWRSLKSFPRLLRYFVYMLPVGTILLIPVLLGIYAFDEGQAPIGGAGGVLLLWFGIWLEIVWLSLWVARIITAIIPYIFKLIARILGSTNPKNWKDTGHQMELPTALFLWMLAVLISFLPIVNNHRAPNPALEPGELTYITWIKVVQKIIIACFVLATLNFVEKILIQWIATSFHQRTYSKRIEDHRVAVNYLVHLYEHSKLKINFDDSIWGATNHQPAPGTRTPMKMLRGNARTVLSTAGNVVHKVAGDFTGRKFKVNHSRKVVLEMLQNTDTAQTLARLIFRSLQNGESEMITIKEMEGAFPTNEEADSCFNLLDKDLNGDLTMEELEGTCDEIHRERKSISASVKDLDSVIKKLDNVFLTLCIIIAIVVFVSIISGSAASALASAGTAVLGLAWVLQSTAQEFLQSVIFVFVKHPYDVGDRVTVYGNTGSTLRGDDYYVTEIHLLFTAFKKIEGHIVQAPNSVLNSLFILNHQRSNGLADPITLVLRWGTAPELIDTLKERMLQFVEDNKRDYQTRIITEFKTLNEVYSFTLKFVFFHKSSFQNELIRLNRHNKFVAKLMYEMVALGIEGPRRQEPGGNPEYPFYWTQVAPPAYRSTEVKVVPQSPLMSPIPEEETPGEVPEMMGPRAGAASGIPQKMPSTGSGSYRARADSCRSSGMATGMARANMLDFQDVYEVRRREGNINRSTSLHMPHAAEVLRQQQHQQEERDRVIEREISNASDSRRSYFGAAHRHKKGTGTFDV